MSHPTTASPSSRRRFLELAGGAGAMSVLLAACGEKDETIPPGDGTARRDRRLGVGDAGILNFALTLEYVEADFYRQAVESGGITERRIADLAKAIGVDEQEHVAALRAALAQLGARPVAQPRTSFERVLGRGQQAILEAAATIENLGAAAYLGQAGRIEDADVLATALSIHSTEGRHAAALNRLAGRSIVPDGAFAKPASLDEVLAGVEPFILA